MMYVDVLKSMSARKNFQGIYLVLKITLHCIIIFVQVLPLQHNTMYPHCIICILNQHEVQIPNKHNPKENIKPGVEFTTAKAIFFLTQ